MRLPVEKIKEAILHPDQMVREAAVYYFSQSHSDDPTVMPLVIQAHQRYGADAFSTFSFLEDLVQTAETFPWIIREIERIGESTEEREQSYRFALVRALRKGNFDLQKQHLDKIHSLHSLDAVSKQMIAQRITLASKTADELWEELNEFCAVEDEKETLGEDYEYGRSVVSALAPHRERFGPQVLSYLSDPTKNTGWLEVFLVRLAGEMKLEPAIPLLADRFEDADTFACEEAYRALEMIGSDGVVQELARRNVTADWGVRLAIASTLEKVHTDFSVRTCLDLLNQEDDEFIRGFLLEAVLMNFCPEGIEPARQYLLKTAKSPEMLEVRSALLVACTLLGETFLEFQAWQADTRHDVDYRKQWYKDNPFSSELGENGESADDSFDEDDDAERPTTVVRRRKRIGRNDPCPCGSGKKFKKCCYGKMKVAEETDSGDAEAMSGFHSSIRRQEYPIGTIAFYGPDNRTTTKIVAAVIKRENAEPILERWVGTSVRDNPKVRRQMKAFLDRHRVKSVVASEGNIGCPHEEGMDFPTGEDCPFCPFWVGKQGSGQGD